jgi:hypothetical protein
MNRNRLKLVDPEDVANASGDGAEAALASPAGLSAETPFLRLVQGDEGGLPEDAA